MDPQPLAVDHVTHHARRVPAWLAALGPLLLYGTAALCLFLWARPQLHALESGALLAIGLFGAWRYAWQLVNYARAWAYAAWHYPRLRADAQRLAAQAPPPERIFVVVATYLEEHWVSAESFQSLMANLAVLPCEATVVVAVGSDEDEAVIAHAWRAHPARGRVELVFQRQQHGKRIALGHALRAVARRYGHEPSSVTVLMDGDSWLEPRAIARCLPFFSAFADLGAVTTNESAFIARGGAWYRDWFGLKFGQRHVLFQSHSLSHKVLTLTGRFSVFRTSAVVREEFIAAVERDAVEHWLHGRFRFLMGDDKSTWYQMLRAGWKMLYLPDVNVCSLESRVIGFREASLSLPYRWYGNTLRNNPRALALGPRRTGWFTWLVLLDQRISMWTSLVGIAGALALSAAKSVLYLPLYLAWAVMVRTVQAGVIAAHGHTVTLRTVPLMLYTQWVGALVKIHAWHHLADQRWAKGGASQDSGAPRHPLQRLVPKVVMAASYAVFGFVVLLAHSAIRWPDLHLFAAAAEAGERAIDVRAHGVVPDDGKDDAPALQALIDALPGNAPVTITLPPGQLDFRTPLVIRRSHLTLAGAGAERTRIVSTLQTPAQAVILVQGERGNTLASLAAPLAAQQREMRLDRAAPLRAGDLLWLRQPNDPAFLAQTGARRWDREQPFLRQSMVRVESASGTDVRLAGETGLDYAAGVAQLQAVRPVRGVHLSDFSIEQRVPGHRIEEVAHRYDNLFPQYAVDGIALDWTDGVAVERVAVRAAGRNPISIEHSDSFAVRDCTLENAWNKGDGGSGYLRIARSFHGEVAGCRVRGIRHVALQWSAAFNRVHDLYTEVDINFHGGWAHHNTVENITSAVPPEHPWPAVFQTPPDARWAPPDGPGNRVSALRSAAYTAPADRAASPAR